LAMVWAQSCGIEALALADAAAAGCACATPPSIREATRRDAGKTWIVFITMESFLKERHSCAD